MSTDEMPDLFGVEPSHPARTRARTTDPETSKAAAERITPTMTAKQQRVLAIHREHRRGLDDWRLHEIIGGGAHEFSTYRTRRSELSDPKKFDPPLIVKSGRVNVIWESGTRNERTIWILREYFEEEQRRERELEERFTQESEAMLVPPTVPTVEGARVERRCHCGAWAHWGQGAEYRCYAHRGEIGFDSEGKWREGDG